MIGHIITLALCVAMVLIFRQMDANNKSIDKIKRFSDKLKEDLDAYFEGRTQSLQNAAIDLDTKQTQAIASVKRLQKFDEDFAVRSKEIEDRINGLSEVETRIDGYDSIIKDLIDKTGRAEENLQHLSAQSKHFDGTFKKIKELQDKLVQIDGAIPGLTDKFSQQNQEQLQKIESTLLDEYTNRAQILGQQYDAYTQKCVQLLNEVDQKIQASFDAANKKATVLEDAVFKQLQEQSNRRKDEYIAAVEDKNVSIRKSIEAQINEIQDFAKKFRNQLGLEMGAYEESVRTDMQNISSKFQDTLQMLDNRVAEFERTTVERIEEFNTRLDSNDMRIESSFNETERKIATFKEDIKQNITQVAAALEDMNGEFSAKTMELQTNFGNVEAKLQGTADEKIQEIENALHDHISSIEREMNNSYERVSSDLETKNTTLLNEIATRFEAYQADVMYRFKSFDKYSSDINLLEEQLRGSMENIKSEIANEFETFSHDQQTKQTAFEQAIQKGTADISKGLQDLETELNNLKAQATTNVSEKLKLFEDDFFKDLNKKGEVVDVEIAKWTDSMEEKLNALAAASEDDRHKIELQYADDLKLRLAEFSDRFKDQTGRFETQLQGLEGTLQDKLAEYEANIKDFVDQSQAALDEAKISSNEHIKAALDTHSAEIQEQLGNQRRDLTAQIKTIFTDVDSTREKTEASLESVKTDFETWRDRLATQFNEYKEAFDEKIANLETSSKDKIEQVGSSFTVDIENYTAKAREEKDRIANELEDLRSQMERSVSGFDARAAEMMGEFKKSYESMLEETAQKIREQNMEADQKMRELKAQAQEIRDQTEATQEKMRLKMQTDANAINLTMDDVDKRLKSFVQQTQLFDKADELKNDLESKLEALKTEITRVESFRQVANDLEQEFTKIRRMEDEVSQKLNKFGAEKKRIEIIEGDFNTLLTMSTNMEQKIADLRNSNDDLQELQLEIRRYQDSITDIAGRYDRLEKKNDLLEQTMASIDRSFENLQQIEKRIAACDLEAKKLPEQVADIKKTVDKLLDGNTRVNEAVERLASLDVILKDTETRIGEMQKAREWLARTETRMNEISKEAQEQVKIMGDLIKNEPQRGGASKPRGEEGAPSIAQRDTVVKLAKSGWGVDEIASRMHISRGEVELILELNTGVK